MGSPRKGRIACFGKALLDKDWRDSSLCRYGQENARQRTLTLYGNLETAETKEFSCWPDNQ
jgi:hypothetical protein